jgi:hemolysin III
MKIEDITIKNYTKTEELINTLSHLAGLILSWYIIRSCLCPAVRQGNAFSVICAVLYLFGTTVMFLGSALYHGMPAGKAKKVLRVADHCLIFFAVAGTATGCAPAVYKTVGPAAAVCMLSVAWIGAFGGFAITVFGFEKYRSLQMALYVATAAVCAACGAKAYSVLPAGAFFAFACGSALLIAGIIIYGLGRTRRFLHSVFHFFVLGGLFVYWLGIAEYCY